MYVLNAFLFYTPTSIGEDSSILPFKANCMVEFDEQDRHNQNLMCQSRTSPYIITPILLVIGCHLLSKCWSLKKSSNI